MSIEEVLSQAKKDLLKEEGITEDILNVVNLNIEFSPVVPCKGDRPYDVIETRGGGYLIQGHPLFTKEVSKEELKIMRCRFLVNRKPFAL